MRLALALLSTVSLVAGAGPDWTKLDPYAVDLLQRYLRIDTSNPPANTAPAAALLKGELEKQGFEVRLFDAGQGRVNLFTRLPGKDRSKKPLMLLNHIDVVPVDRKAWSVDPFGGVLKDGWVWGRGALDMKSVGVQQMVALMAMKQAGIVPARDIVLLASADEEAGGVYGVRWMLQNQPREMDVEYVLDEGGFITRDVLAPGKLVAGISAGEKQIAWLKLRAKGVAGHGSQPMDDNSNLILLRAIARAMDVPDRGKPNETVQQMKRRLGELAKNKFTNAILGNTMSLTTLKSGVGDPPKANVIPSAAEATIDCRLLPGVNAEEFVSEVKARINDPRVTVELVSPPAVDPGESNTETPLFAALRASILKHHPEAIVTPILIPWGTDSSILRMQGVTAYGLFPMLLDAPTIATFHSDEERVPVTEFLKGIRIYFDAIQSDF